MSRLLPTCFAIGAVFGALAPFGLWMFGLPGFLVAFSVGLMRSGGVSPGGWVLYCGFNAVVYGLLGAGCASLIERSRKKSRQGSPTIPECCVCGYKWPIPTSAECPACGSSTAFLGYVGRSPTTFRCEKCGYDLTGIISQRCPECGQHI